MVPVDIRHKIDIYSINGAVQTVLKGTTTMELKPNIYFSHCYAWQQRRKSENAATITAKQVTELAAFRLQAA